MQSDYEMAGIHHERNQQSAQMEEQHRFMVENNASTSSPFYTINPNYHFPQPHPHPLLQQINNLPITQQFFQYQHPHYRSMSMLEQQQEEIRLDHSQTAELVQGSFFPVSEGQEDALIRGSERYCTQPRQTCLAVWQNQEDSAIIKQPFWKEFSNGNATERNKQDEDQEMYRSEENIIKSLEENKFGELEAIYGDDIHRIASESVLTTNHNVSFPELALNDSNQAMAAEIDNNNNNIGSESASVGGREVEALHKRKRARESMSRFFKSLVKKLAKQQEDLQRSFMETIERLDQERKEREQVWRERELAKLQKEEAARAHERSLASSRESALVSCLEKLTGQKINFQPFKIKEEQNHSSLVKFMKRWPQAEVEALIQIRTNLESKFATTPKGLLWEEVSNSMSLMGFQRNARRCKEKWENMHKCTSVKRRKEITREQLNSDFVNQGIHDKDENGSKKEDMEE
ncbi:trihelix transcription factor DF1-like [Solanum verrucosum]|uniref:trihelix transcription factor DF1-like n=1 Tax=Solanum verrucosum TaxID=315347 RepID=UPI0020D194B6|nr:trihelix transcription factor DF1-like [Solanum verrucosum]